MRLLRALCRAVVPSLIAFVAFTVTQKTTWAQNENETTGFRANHVFESSDDGEHIDLLTGGLTLPIPLGPRYQVNDRLSYQITLTYNSKVWDYSGWMEDSSYQAVKTMLRGQGQFGPGFNVHFGRIVQDIHWGECPNNTGKMKTQSWAWITQDGGAHDIYWYSPCDTVHQDSTSMMTTDQTYTQVINSGTYFTVLTPDGLKYTLAQHVADYDAPPQTNLMRGDN